jgi:acyl carrier protein
MGIDLLTLAFRLEKQIGVKLRADQFSTLAKGNDPPDIKVGDLFDLLCSEARQSGLVDLESNADTLWPIYQRTIADTLGVDPAEVTNDKGLIRDLGAA